MNFFSSFLGLLFGEYHYLDFNVHLWFLPCIFVTVVLFNILVCVGGRAKTGRKLSYIVSTLMSLVYIVSSITGYTLPELPWRIDRVFKYIGFYAVGNYLRQSDAVNRVRENPGVCMTATAVLLLVLNFILSLINLPQDCSGL